MRISSLCVLLVLGTFGNSGEKSTVELFNKKDLAGWTFRGGDKNKKSKWGVVATALHNGDDGRGVDLLSELQHGDCELHVEFTVPKGSNSGIYFQGQYEIQILDSFGKKDKDLKFGDCGGIYNTAAPRVNASRAPGEWQVFVITFQAPRFDDKGMKIANAKFIKVIHNDVTIHQNVEVKGPTTAALGGPERPMGPLMLQGDHGPVTFRSIKMKMLK